LSYAYAEEVTVNVPFEYTADTCFYSYEAKNNLFAFDCQWTMTPTDEQIVDIAKSDPELIPEATVDAIIEKHLVIDEPQKPLTMNEKKIIELEEKLAEEGKLVSHEDQLLRALLSYQDKCELGTEQGAPIQNYELFTIATYEPYTHTDLGTQYILKQIELAIQECKSQQILKTKILGEQYLHIPSTNEPKIIYQTNATLPEDVQAKYDEAKMSDFFAQQSIQFAEEFQCSILGKQQGHCIKESSDIPIPEPTLSKASKQALQDYWIYRNTGEADIPAREQVKQLTPLDILKQYMKAYDIKAADLED